MRRQATFGQQAVHLATADARLLANMLAIGTIQIEPNRADAGKKGHALRLWQGLLIDRGPRGQIDLHFRLCRSTSGP
ncbi:hypothetical protein A9P79_29955 (plasmid) [Cupriavidus taiwanensis]|nr:hypothetical protein A9P79_29955 [Cupriavidus taiwanensis]